MVKRKLKPLLYAVLAICLTSGGWALSEGEKTLEVGITFQYAVQGENVWITKGKTVEIYADIGSASTASFEIGYESAHIAANDTGAFLLNANAGYIERVLPTGEVAQTWNVPSGVNIQQMEASDENLYIVASEEEAHGDGIMTHYTHGVLYIQPLAGGDMRKADAAENISGISTNGESVCLYSITNSSIMIMNAEASVVEGTYAGINADYAVITDGGDIYLLRASMMAASIMRLDTTTGKSEKVASIDGIMAGLRSDGTRLYTMNWAENKLVMVNIPEDTQNAESDKVITIAFENGYDLNEERLTIAVDTIEDEYPGCRIKYVEFENFDAMLTSLMSGDGEYDILFLNNCGNLPDVQDLYEAGALYNLSECDSIADTFDKLIDIKGQFSVNGELYAVPVEPMIDMFWVNIELFDELGLNVPQSGWTWSDFFKIGDQVEQLRAGGRDVYLMTEWEVPFFITQYHVNELYNGALNYHDAAFMSVMEKYKAALDAGIIMADNMTFDYPYPENSLFSYDSGAYHALMSAAFAEFAFEPDREFMLPPAYDEDTRPIVSWRTASINIRTEYPDICGAFLAEFISPDMLMKESVAWVYGFILKGSDSSGTSGELYYDMWPSERRENFWLTSMENSVRYRVIKDLEVKQYSTLFPAYKSGEISLEEFCDSSQSLLDTILGE